MTEQASMTPLQLTKAKARANCAQGWHQWHPTFTLGEKLCVICGAFAVCPQCQHWPPTHARLVLCALHRDEEQRRDQA